MTRLAYVLLVLAVALVFFVAIPGTGAFVVRGRWRRFRARMSAASLLPTVEYTHLAQPAEHGLLRFLGRLEAIQGADTIWVTNGHFSVAAEVANVTVHMMPSSQEAPESGREPSHELVPDETPRGVRWRRIFSLPQGMQFFLAGPFVAERGRGTFRSQERDRLLVVIFDGEPASLMPRAIWGGRQRNEYWNQYTAASLVLGAFALLFLAFLLLRSPYNRVPALFALTAAVFPVAAMLPPGILLYLPYRQLWQRARRMRAERDLLRLPLRYFADAPEGAADTRLPDGERYGVRVGAAVRCLVPPAVRAPAYMETQPAPSSIQTRTYGALGRDELGEYLTRPLDPMAELVRIPADPGQLARVCAGKARLLELMSAILIVGDMAINLFLVLLGLSRLLW